MLYGYLQLLNVWFKFLLGFNVSDTLVICCCKCVNMGEVLQFPVHVIFYLQYPYDYCPILLVSGLSFDCLEYWFVFTFVPSLLLPLRKVLSNYFSLFDWFSDLLMEIVMSRRDWPTMCSWSVWICGGICQSIWAFAVWGMQSAALQHVGGINWNSFKRYTHNCPCKDHRKKRKRYQFKENVFIIWLYTSVLNANNFTLCPTEIFLYGYVIGFAKGVYGVDFLNPFSSCVLLAVSNYYGSGNYLKCLCCWLRMVWCGCPSGEWVQMDL